MIFYIICHDNTISLAFKKLKTAIPVVFSTCTATITHTFYPIDPLLPYDTKFQDKKMRRNFLSVFNHQLLAPTFANITFHSLIFILFVFFQSISCILCFICLSFSCILFYSTRFYMPVLLSYRYL